MGTTLAGKAAVVTGAGGGIWRAIALALAAEGAKVVVNDLGTTWRGQGSRPQMADGVVQEIKAAGGTAIANFESVATMQGGERIVAACEGTFGKIDVLVTCAGIVRTAMLWDMTEDDFDAVVATHLKGTFSCTQAAARRMMKQRSGRIIMTASDSGLFGSATMSGYAAAKGGIYALALSAALELGPFGITVNALCPSATSRVGDGQKPEERGFRVAPPARIVAEFGAPRPPEDVAPMVAYLARDEAANINGQAFRVWSGKIGRFSPASLSRLVHKQGRWTQEELAVTVPNVLMQGVTNPSPPQGENPVFPFMLE